MSIPPLPPGFVLEQAPPTPAMPRPVPPPRDIPPLPPGFVLEPEVAPPALGSAADEPALEIDIIGGTVGAVPSVAELDALRGRAPAEPLPALGGEEESWLDRQLRGVAFGGRSVLQGAGGLLGALGGDAFNHYLMPGDQPTYRDLGAKAADWLGLPEAQTSTDRIMGDIGEALTGTALTMGAGGLAGGTPMLTRLREILTAQPIRQAVGTALGAGAMGTTREAGGGEGAQLTAGILGGLVPTLSPTAGAMALRGGLRGGESNRAALAGAIDDFAALGASPSVGQGTGGRLAQSAESMLSGFVPSAGVMRRFGVQQADQLGEGIQAVANRISRNPSGERAGRAIERGVQSFAGNTAATRKALYWQVDQHIPGDAKVPMANTQRALSELTTPTPGAEQTTAALMSPKIKQLSETISNDLANGDLHGLPYEAVKQVRSKIGEELSDFGLSNDRPTAQLKQLYAALSQDMEAAAVAQGPAAVAAVKRANRYFKASADRLESLERVVDKNGGPENVFNAAMSGTRDGATTLRTVMRSLPEDSQKALTAAVVKRMGLATPGAQVEAGGEAFSAASFLTNWNRVSPEARRELFGRLGPDMSRDIDKIARVAERIKEGAGALANPSGTANKDMAFAYTGSIAGAALTGQFEILGGLLASGAGGNALARAMTNKRAVKWLAKQSEFPLSAWPTQLAILKRTAADTGDDELADIAAELPEQLPEPDSE